jgi:hypothetical protein
MKKMIIATVISFLICSIQLSAQPQWKFHVAFKDATGAKDTIWFIWDTTATFEGADTALGEVSVNIDNSKFSVWTSNHGLMWYDTIKTVAHPYDYSFEHRIEAINYELPITITWDSSLLRASWLPPAPVGWVNFARIDNNYFFFFNNNEWTHEYDMTLSDSVTAPFEGNTDPWAWQYWVHFPMSIFLVQDPTLDVGNPNFKCKAKLEGYPNPFEKNTNIEFYLENESHVDLSVYNLQGKKITDLVNQNLNSGNHIIKWDGLDHAGKSCKPGLYFVYLIANGISAQSIKLVKY